MHAYYLQRGPQGQGSYFLISDAKVAIISTQSKGFTVFDFMITN